MSQSTEQPPNVSYHAWRQEVDTLLAKMEAEGILTDADRRAVEIADQVGREAIAYMLNTQDALAWKYIKNLGKQDDRQ